MNTMIDPPAGFDRRWLALSLSIVLNLFLLGVIAGHFLAHRQGATELPLSAAPLARAAARAEAVLAPADAAAFRNTLEHHRPQYAEAAEQVTAARRALERQIVAEPYDPQAVRQALAAWRASWNQFIGDFSGPLVDALSSISPDGRHRLIDIRRKRLERRQPDPTGR